jgi:hypothetical protein
MIAMQFVVILPAGAGIATIAVLLIRQAWLWLNGTLAREAAELRAEQEHWHRVARDAAEAKIAEEIAAPLRWQASLDAWDRSPPGRRLARLQGR